MNGSLKLISLNIERAKHLDLVVPFLRDKNPDIACLQEVREEDVSLLREAAGGGEHIFAPMHRHPSEEIPPIVGICIVTRLPLKESSTEYYRGSSDSMRVTVNAPRDKSDDGVIAKNVNSALMRADVEKDGALFRVATTHFLWSAYGEANEYQRQDMRNLLGLLQTKGEFVLTGDFNAPRGGEIFSMLAERYKDNVPAHYMTSIDASLHRAGKDRPQELADKMVDGLFSTPGYKVSNVELISGVSDHCAIVANVSNV